MVKKLLFTGLMASLLIFANSTSYTHSNPTGAPASRTGAPRANGTSELTCAVSGCHGSSLNAGPHSVALTIAGNPSAFEPNVVYPCTVSVVGATGNFCGFQVVALDPALASVGTFTAGTGNKVVTGTGRSYVTHSNRNAKQWTFNWKAPAVLPDSVVFYFAGMENVGGYKTYTNKLKVINTISTLVADVAEKEDFVIFPTIATEQLTVALGTLQPKVATIQIVGMDGREVYRHQTDPGTTTHTIDLPRHMKAGNYIVRRIADQSLVSRQFLKR